MPVFLLDSHRQIVQWVVIPPHSRDFTLPEPDERFFDAETGVHVTSD